MAGTRAPGRTAATLAVLALLAGIPEVGSPLDRDEQWKRIEFEVRELEREIEARGALYGDPAVDAYLQSVLERLFPENQGRLRVRAFRDSEFNVKAWNQPNAMARTPGVNGLVASLPSACALLRGTG